MVSVSELTAHHVAADKHGEPSVKRHDFTLRDRESAERSIVDNRSTVHRVDFGQNPSADAAEALPVDAPDRPVGGWIKRAFDIAISLTSIILMAPIMAFIAALIYLTMGRPILFGQQRVGFKLAAFRCFKFRTMVTDADQCLTSHLQHCPDAAHAWSASQKLRNDPRVTPLGNILRKSSLDELPQLFNILRGDMSCIGPRPVLMNELTHRYGRAASDYVKAKPGLTGMWQVNGRGKTSYAHRVACDRYYVRRWSLLLDLRILFRTVPAVMKFDETS
jgi:exopolysaccharide production protein ExoY